MQFRLLSALLIFIGSYFPLAVILAVQDIDSAWYGQSLCTPSLIFDGRCHFDLFKNPVLSICFLVVTALSVALSNTVLRKVSFPFAIEIKEAKAVPNEIINYTFPYVVSFMGMSYSEPEKILGFGVFLLWMFAITYKSGQIIMNPLLLMFNWRLYEAKVLISGHGRDVRVLKQGQLLPGFYMSDKIQDFFIAKER